MSDKTPPADRLMTIADFVRMGAEYGFKIARSVPAPMPVHLKIIREGIAKFKSEQCAAGRSLDEMRLYEIGFETALSEGLLAAKIGTSPRPIRVKTDDGDVVIEDQLWVPQSKS